MSIRNLRIGKTRFMVPHESFDWYLRGMALSALAVGAFVGMLSWIYHQQLFDALGLSNQAGWPELVSQYGRLSLLAAGVTTVATALFMTLVSMFLFHRVVGPLVSLKAHMKSVANGEDVGPLSFRDTDQLDDVRDAYNEMLVALDLIEPDKPLDHAPVQAPAPEPEASGDAPA